MSVRYSPKIITDGLVLYLDAGNSKSYPGSGTTWYDLSGNGNHGTIYNSPIYENNGFKFNGTTQYIDTNLILNDLYLGSTLFIFGYNHISYPGSTLGHHNSKRWYWIIAPNGTVQHGVQNTFLNDTNYSGISVGEPFCLTITYGGGTTSDLYINSNLIQTLTGISNSSSYSPNGSYIIGASRANLTTINGYSDQNVGICIMYNKELAPIEIQQNYNTLKGRFSLT